MKLNFKPFSLWDFQNWTTGSKVMLVFSFSLFSFSLVSILLCNYKKNNLCEGMVRRLGQNKYVCLYRVFIWFHFFLSRGPAPVLTSRNRVILTCLWETPIKFKNFLGKVAFTALNFVSTWCLFIHFLVKLAYTAHSKLYRFRGCFFLGGGGVPSGSMMPRVEFRRSITLSSI